MPGTSEKKIIPPTKPLSIWKEKDVIDGSIVDARVLIINGPGCSWAKKVGCTMCGYNNDVMHEDISYEDLMAQIDHFMRSYVDEPYIKIFTSGSYLDPSEISPKAQTDIIKRISDLENVKRILIESRPEYMTRENLKPLIDHQIDIEIAVGLETTSDRNRSLYISKGFSLDQYIEAGRNAIDMGFLLKTYLLMKPPMMSEMEAIDDMIRSITEINELFPGSNISINPMNVQNNTQVESLYNKGKYRPPWLWSLLKVLREGMIATDGNTRLMSSPTAGGRRRGAHNCGHCDDEILDIISEFSLDNGSSLETSHCPRCYEIWLKDLKTSGLNPLRK